MGLGESQDAANVGAGNPPAEPEAPVPPTTPRKPRVTGKDLPKTAPKISKKTVHFVHRSFESLHKSIDNISRENDYFVMKLSADEVEMLKQMKTQLAASGPSVNSESPVKDTAQSDLVDQLDGQQQAGASAQ